MSFATIFLPSSGILSAYTDIAELESALGIYLITWFMVTVMFMWGDFYSGLTLFYPDILSS
jgi:hypothetical protein